MSGTLKMLQKQHKHTTNHQDSGCHHGNQQSMVQDYRQRFWVSLLLTIPILILSPMLQKLLGLDAMLQFPGDTYVLFGLSSTIYLYGGWPFYTGLTSEIRAKNPGMMTLIGVAITTAYIYSATIVFGLPGKPFFWELATLIDIMLLGHWVEMKSVMGAGEALKELSKLMPETARLVLANGKTQSVALQNLKIGDQLLIKPGEKVPADARIVEGKSALNESMLTGESLPVTKREGHMVIGGSINGEGALVVRVENIGDQTFLSHVIKLVQEAQTSKSKTQDIAGRAAFWLTMIALGGGGLTFAAWAWMPQASISFAMERMVTVMVITCPHALGLAVPLVVAVSTSLAAHHGLLIRDRSAFETARKTQVVVFDKTGTLTKGLFGITDVLVFDKAISEEELVTYAASVEQNSEHPLARGIVSKSDQRWSVKDFISIPGQGAQGLVKGKKIQVVGSGYLRQSNISFNSTINSTMLSDFSLQGKTVVYVLIDGQVKGAIALADIIRPESTTAVKALQAMGVHCIMLTGDNKHVADWIGNQLGVNEVIAEVLPEQKAQKIQEIKARGWIVAMTGDGVNDAPALAQADIGIAIGAGTDVAIETADIVLVKSNPLDVVALIGLARKTYAKMIQNLMWATGYNVFAIPIAAGVLYKAGIILSPAVGAVLMTLSTIVCAVNAKLLRYGR
ncbi:MAG: copper-translocating P-type ATPase [Pseudomonadota bacterium]